MHKGLSSVPTTINKRKKTIKEEREGGRAEGGMEGEGEGGMNRGLSYNEQENSI